MSTAEIKSKIIQQMDSLDENCLEELYGLFLNHINSKNEIDEWSNLSTEQKLGIDLAIEDIKQGQGLSHEIVMSKVRKKFLNE